MKATHRKRATLIATAAAAALMIGAAPAVTQAAPHGDRDGNRGRQTQRHDDHNRHRGDRHDRYDHRDNDRRHYSHHGRHHRDRHDNKGSFNLSFLFGRPRVITNTVTRVYVPGTWETRVIPALYETRYGPCGTPYQVLVHPATTQRIWVPGHYIDTCESGGAHAIGGSTARISIGGRF